MNTVKHGFAVLLILILTVACGGPRTDTPHPSSSDGSAQDSSGRTLVVALPTNPDSLDPQDTVDSQANVVTRNIFDFLVRFDGEMNLQPALAETWTFLDDRTLELNLRRGVTFHDGAEWNARAAKLNLDRLRTQALKRSDLIEPYVESVDVVDEFTVRLNLKVEFAPILNNLAHDAMGMISPKALETNDPQALARRPVGTGPYILEEWREGDHVRLKPNPAYWGGKPQVAGLVFRVVPEPSIRTGLMQTGDVHMISGVAPADAEMLKTVDSVRVINKPSVNYVYMGLNNLHGPLQDARVRQALNYATDKESMISGLLRGYATPSTSTLTPTVWGYANVGSYEYDLDKARKLLKEAGYEDGFEFDLISPRGRYLMDYEVAEAIQGSWEKIGVKVNLLTYEWGTLLNRIKQRPEKAQYDGFILNCGSRTGHASYCLSILYHSNNWAPTSSNRMYFAHETVDHLIDTVTVTIDEDEQRALYQEIQEIVHAEAPVIFLYAEDVIVAMHEDLEGVEILPSEQYNFHRAAFKK